MKRPLIGLLRVTYGWSSFLMPGGARDFWQAAVYLAAAYVFACFFVLSGPLGQLVDADTGAPVCAAVGLFGAFFNYWFALKHGREIAARGSRASTIAAYVVILSAIGAGIAAIFF